MERSDSQSCHSRDSTSASGITDTVKTLLGTFRIPFLLLTPACVSVGLACALTEQKNIDAPSVLLVLFGALMAHVSVNVFNEYDDFNSGLDLHTSRTPFSGGSGALPSHPKSARLAHITAWITLLSSALVGLYFVFLQGYALVPLGLTGLFLLVSYTRWWVYHPVLCLLAPGLGFGVLMVQGSNVALTGNYSVAAFVASLCPTFLVSGLLLLNQFPDVEADQTVGRNHYPIAIGRAASARLYAVLLLLAYLSVVAGIVIDVLPIHATLALFTVPLAMFSVRIVMKTPDDIPALAPAMAVNVMINLLTPLLLATGLWLSIA
ncbi:prenyltransferase [Alteromonas sp. H39]|uniref:prenyltransferase n=1 Tax=Alteromonas sp. H39 TaxID=3389876 RepID=UPI0039DFA22C